MGFHISALSVDEFSHLFGQDDEVLATNGVRRVVADSDFGFPCRVSLQDAEIGESLLLLNYEHQPARTPYRSSHAIYVRERASQARLVENEIPDVLKKRLLSVRAFDAAGMMVDADVVDGQQLDALIERLFANDSAEYLHIHNARLGCYAALVRRA
jgi:hypothetical protein